MCPFGNKKEVFDFRSKNCPSDKVPIWYTWGVCLLRFCRSLGDMSSSSDSRLGPVGAVFLPTGWRADMQGWRGAAINARPFGALVLLCDTSASACWGGGWRLNSPYYSSNMDQHYRWFNVIAESVLCSLWEGESNLWTFTQVLILKVGFEVLALAFYAAWYLYCTTVPLMNLIN